MNSNDFWSHSFGISRGGKGSQKQLDFNANSLAKADNIFCFSIHELKLVAIQKYFLNKIIESNSKRHRVPFFSVADKLEYAIDEKPEEGRGIKTIDIK